MHVKVKDTDNTKNHCSIRRTLRLLVTGNLVIWRSYVNTQARVKEIIKTICKDTSILNYANFYDNIKPIVTNIN